MGGMDSFQVLDEIGRGTFGTVYQANVLHESMGRFRLDTQVAHEKDLLILRASYRKRNDAFACCESS
jgi:hypothetical protein